MKDALNKFATKCDNYSVYCDLLNELLDNYISSFNWTKDCWKNGTELNGEHVYIAEWESFIQARSIELSLSIKIREWPSNKTSLIKGTPLDSEQGYGTYININSSNPKHELYIKLNEHLFKDGVCQEYESNEARFFIIQDEKSIQVVKTFLMCLFNYLNN